MQFLKDMLFLEHLVFLIERKILNASINSVISNIFRSFNGCCISFVDSMSVLHRKLKFCNLYDVITRHGNRHCHEHEEVHSFNFPFYVNIYSIGFTTGDQHTTNHGTMIKNRFFLDLFCHYKTLLILSL